RSVLMPRPLRTPRRSRTCMNVRSQSRDGARGCRKASTPCDGRHGVDCCVRVVVTVVVDGGGTEVVVVRSVVVVCVVGLDPQAASSAVPPSSVAASNSRIPGCVLV